MALALFQKNSRLIRCSLAVFGYCDEAYSRNRKELSPDIEIIDALTLVPVIRIIKKNEFPICTNYPVLTRLDAVGYALGMFTKECVLPVWSSMGFC